MSVKFLLPNKIKLNYYIFSCSNHSFYGNREPQLLMKKQTEDSLNASLASVLCCRLHEGFMIKASHFLAFLFLE